LDRFRPGHLARIGDVVVNLYGDIACWPADVNHLGRSAFGMHGARRRPKWRSRLISVRGDGVRTAAGRRLTPNDWLRQHRCLRDRSRLHVIVGHTDSLSSSRPHLSIGDKSFGKSASALTAYSWATHAFRRRPIAAIDNTTLKLMNDGASALGVVFFFSLGPLVGGVRVAGTAHRFGSRR